MLRERSVRFDLQPYDITDHKAPGFATEPEGCHTIFARRIAPEVARYSEPAEGSGGSVLAPGNDKTGGRPGSSSVRDDP
jgi:hypothetical protein